MARVRSGQAPAWPLSSARSARRAPGSSVTSRVRSPGTFTCARCPAVTVTLEAGGAGTYTQSAIPGARRFRLAQRRAKGSGIAFKLRMRPVDEGN